jgi:chemotaxis protein methyltransferase CheR
MSDPTASHVDSDLLNDFNRFISKHTGLNFSKNRLGELVSGIHQAAEEFGFDDPVECIKWLMSGSLTRNQIDTLSSFLTIGETYFFREKESFQHLENSIISRILRDKSKTGNPVIRIWSAACSSGEEPYSIAMLLDRNRKRLEGWSISILATDINVSALQKAKKGVYSNWAFRDNPDWVKEHYFSKIEGNLYQISDRIKEMVEFEYLNLAENCYPSLITNTNAIDIIFCRNVLMYFLPKISQAVIQRFYLSLVMGGTIVVGPTDAFHILNIRGFKRDENSTSVFTKIDPEGADRVTRESANVEPVEPMLPKSGGAFFPPKKKYVYKQRQARFNNTDKDLEEALKDYRLGDYKKVIQRLDTELPADPIGINKGSRFNLLARVYANLGQLEDALKWCDKALDVEKLNAETYYLKSTILQEENRLEEALTVLRKCIYLNPDYILAHYTLGNIYRSKGNDSDARRSFKNALDLLEKMDTDDVVSSEEMLTAGRLKMIIQSSFKMSDGN